MTNHRKMSIAQTKQRTKSIRLQYQTEAKHPVSRPKADDQVWVKSDDQAYYELGFVSKDKSVVETLSGRVVSNPTIYPTSHAVVEDMRDLAHINEATILHNLEVRAQEEKPFTYIGPILVSVNPLCDVPFSSEGPHPFSLAETVVGKMRFFLSQGKTVSQTVVVSGESGSGKTVNSKLVLQHVVQTCCLPVWGEEESESLDQKLLNTNPILESFGNASTLRNENSSRFGKFFKLHMDSELSVSGACVKTYLLERSRVSCHSPGERSFHIFYEMLAGVDEGMRKRLKLDGAKRFRYLCGLDKDVEFRPSDRENFSTLGRALDNVGFDADEKLYTYQIVAGILHFGNIEIVQDQGVSNQGDVATVKKNCTALAAAADMFGMPYLKDLAQLFSVRWITVGRETTTVPLTVEQAKATRDAIAKDMYARLFDWINLKVNLSLDPETATGGGFIGVLDIFGFESFERNDLEQLLINYANERLQVSFEKQILGTEADLYIREGLTTTTGGGFHAPKKKRMSTRMVVDMVEEILGLIDSEGKRISPSDYSFNKTVHERFADNHVAYKPVHANHKKSCFTVVHFAGAVTYTVGNFLEKNDYTLPKETANILSQAGNEVMQDIWKAAKVRSDNTKRGVKASVVQKFSLQIEKLMDVLDTTSCSFIRCLKPNPLMKRNWFDRRYVASQLKSLGVTRAALTLRDGLPLSLPFADLIDMFNGIMVQPVEDLYYRHARGDPATFVAAMLYAFDIPRPDYRIGRTRVFLQPSCLTCLEAKTSDVKVWGSTKTLGNNKVFQKWLKRYTTFLIRRRWKTALIAVRFANKLLKTSLSARMVEYSAVTIQKHMRGAPVRKNFIHLRQGALMGQKLFRGGQARAHALEKINDMENKIKIAKAKAKARRNNPRRTLEEHKFDRVRKRSVANFNPEAFRKAIEETATKEIEKEEKIIQSYVDGGAVEPPPVQEPTPATKKEKKQDMIAIAHVFLGGHNTWKKRYVVFNWEARKFTIFNQTDGKPKGKKLDMFSINPIDYNPPPEVMASHSDEFVSDGTVSLPTSSSSTFSRLKTVFASKRGKYVLQAKGGKWENDKLQEDKSVFLAFDKIDQLRKWYKALKPVVQCDDQLVPLKYNRLCFHQDDGEQSVVSQFGDQIKCKNKDCNAVNNTMYGSTCLECGISLDI